MVVLGTGSLDDHDMQLLHSMDSLLGIPGDDLAQELSVLLPTMPMGSHGGTMPGDTR